jgi:hypothetical protein
MKKFILISVAGMVLLPHLLFAGTKCSFKEYPDHYLATCIGDEKAVSGSQQTLSSTKQSTAQNEQNPDTTVTTPYQTDQLPDYISSPKVDPQKESFNFQSAQLSNFSSSPKVDPQKESIITGNQEPSEQNPTLSKRNRAKIEAIHMKDLKRKAMEENAP